MNSAADNGKTRKLGAFLSQEEFDVRYDYSGGTKSDSIADIVCSSARKLGLYNKSSFFHRFRCLFPFFSWFPKYKWRENGFADLIAGCTVGIVQIPQGMAYGDLAGIDPVHGLYTSFFPSLFYIWMGTSRHISLGAFAVVCMMIHDTLTSFFANRSSSIHLPSTPKDISAFSIIENSTISDLSNASTVPELASVDVASSLCLLVGLIQLTLGLLNFGFLSSYLSDQVISGFTTGSAIHVFAAQLDKIFGIKIKRYQGLGKLYFIVRDLFSSFENFNISTITISFVSIMALYITKEYLTPPFKRRYRVPLPIDLIVVIIGTIASYYWNFNEIYKVSIVKYIPKGLPVPSLPRFDIMRSLLSDAFSISFVVFSVSVSMGRIFAKRHNYRINANQEFLALGFMECGTSFFQCFPSSGSLGRSIVFEGAGAKSQLAALVSCSLILSVLLWFAPYFEPLPKCILSCIIIVALKGFFVHFHDLVSVWPKSKIDSALWLISFFAVVVFDVTAGLCISVFVSLFSLILRSQWPKVSILARAPQTDSFVDSESYRALEFKDGVRIFRFNSSLHFANVRLFEENFMAKCSIDLQEAKIWRQNHSLPIIDAEDEQEQTSLSSSSSADQNIEKHKEMSRNLDSSTNNPYRFLTPPNFPHHVIIDCSSFSFVDTMGIQLLQQLYSDLKEVGIRLLFASCDSALLRTFENHKFYDKVPKNCIFPTIADAVTAAGIL